MLVLKYDLVVLRTIILENVLHFNPVSLLPDFSFDIFFYSVSSITSPELRSMTDLFTGRSGGRMGLHPTASSSEKDLGENSVSISSEELHNTKSSLYFLEYVLETFTFS